jgi:D-glycero-D-manno-heptose 1,7-bisphosphate phosphatase
MIRMPFSHRRPVPFSSVALSDKESKKRKAIFLDRDGTIIRHVELLHKSSEVRLIPGAADAIRIMNELGYLVIMVSNQPVVARGIIGPEEVDRLNGMLADRLSKQGAVIDVSYFCPHHTKANIKKYRMACDCRKPGPGMIFAAAKDYYLDLKKSFLVGDSTQDVQAGNRAGVKMILVRTGHGGKDPWQHEGKPDFTAKDILGATRIIKRISKRK